MIQFGVDILLQRNPTWKKNRIALVTNHSATTHHLIPSRKALLENGFNIIKLFSPEHGLNIQGADGALIKDGLDTLTQLPVISLYNEKLAPTENDLSDIEIVLFDIPDIGVRFYTYLWTMTYVLEACALHKKKFIILDRPNPISGNIEFAEGPMLNEKTCASFIGRWNIPLKHSCTLGELALYFNRQKDLNAMVEIIKCEYWNRNMFQPDWGIEFVPTSPAIQSFQSAFLYPGLGLLETTNISEGRGTILPFRIAGAPWMKANILADWFKEKEIKFIPVTNKYANEICYGIKLPIENIQVLKSVLTGLLLIKIIKDNHPQHFKWQPYPTNVNPSGENHLDKLLGIENSELMFDLPWMEFILEAHRITSNLNWATEIKNFLLY
jgi:uncharacterized protein YbbC (DUF1343 family)